MTKEAHNPFLFGDRTYDFIKKMVQIVLPAFGTLYFGLAGIWDLPYADKVTGTIVVVSTFLGVCLGISSAQYTASGKGLNGHITVVPNLETGTPLVTGLHFDGKPEDLEDKDTLTFKVKHELPPNVLDTDP